ncbi:hypothetical protein ABK046_48705, partial [Streptomyces caeruleatus]
AAPTTAAFTTGLTFKGASQSEVVANTRPAGFTLTGIQSFSITSNNIDITGFSASSYNVMTQKSPYKSANVFYDFAMRKCGVVTN